MKNFFTVLLTLMVGVMALPLMAQRQSDLDKALRHIEQRAESWGLTTGDVLDVMVSDEYVSKHNGVRHFYFAQRYAGIPVYGAVNGVHLTRNGEIAFATNTFEPNLAQRVNTTSAQLTAQQAVLAAMDALGVVADATLVIKEQKGSQYTFAGGNMTDNDFYVRLRYMPVRETGEIRLSWDMALDVKKSADYWSVRIDAVTGELLHQHNYTVYCNFDHKTGHTHHADDCAHERALDAPITFGPKRAATVDGSSAYNVFPVPVESPIHGERMLVSDPADPTASPFGWHDIDGMPGADYTITRGNNTHAYLDSEDTNSSQGDEPDGGADLLFDFYFDVDDEPENMLDADVTQLFYMVNMMHDITYAYGFTEEAGNFQRRNYSGADGGNDHVRAEAHDGSGTNNANFSTPADGGNGTMQMYLWYGVAGQVFNVAAPATLAGGYDSGTADFGPAVPAVPIVGELAQAYDEIDGSRLVCNAVGNASEIAGKIAMIDRGDCFFEEKTLAAQAAGAIAVIICNYVDDPIGMAGGVDNADPTIVTVSLKASDCIRIREQLDNGTTVTANIGLPADSGPEKVSSSFDNGIIAHEYGHGISNRLTGGRSNSDCLFNDEQMGEGWSDFFSLITSVRSGDTGATPRGIGNYADRQGVTSGGIRRVPYSTDLAVNPHTMDNILATTAPHPLGEVWVSACWDLYWAMTDLYGFDEDVINGQGGNNKAIQLVMDGMALQSCNPGFMDGRDAILAADFINYDGIHECLIWEVFARRGMGYLADQKSRFDRNDNEMNFEVVPACIQELKIKKTANTGLIVAGETITFTLEVSNDKLVAATGVAVRDELPVGLTYVNGSATGASVTNNGDHLIFDLGTVQPDADKTITYQAISSTANRSVRQFYDGMENGDANWDFFNTAGFDIWDITNANPNTGNRSWYVPNTTERNDQLLILLEPFQVTGDAPALRFYHSYNTEVVNDGGFVEISRNGGTTWEILGDQFIRNGYRGNLAAQTLFSPDFKAYWGNSNGYIDTYIDLSDYQGETIAVRFRFASNTDIAGDGWFMDDFEVMDKVAYEGEACVTSAEGDEACMRIPNGGVIVDTEFVQNTDTPIYDPNVLTVYPNPAGSLLNIALQGETTGTVDVYLYSTNGVKARQWRGQTLQGQMLPLEVGDLPAGFYLMEVHTSQGVYSQKVVKD